MTISSSVAHLSKATNLIAQAIGATRVASLTLPTRTSQPRLHLWRALDELHKAEKALPPSKAA